MFLYSPVAELCERFGGQKFSLDQCEYQLSIPGSKMYEFIKKGTTLLTNMSLLINLTRRCSGVSKKHIHVHAWGSIKLKGVRHSRAKLAGRYPVALCTHWAQLVGEVWRRHVAEQ